MKRLMILLSAVLVLAIALLLQFDLISLFKLSLAGIYDTPTTMYFLWFFPVVLNIEYVALKDSLIVIILASDAFVLLGGFLVYLGVSLDSRPAYRKYHF